MQLPPSLQLLAQPIVWGIALVLFLVEFIADKVPVVDSAWDAVHTFIRPPAAALIAYGAFADVPEGWKLGAALLAASVAFTSHGAKATTRAAANTSPEPFSNWTASLAEDALVIAGLWTALHYPLVFLALLAVFVGLVIWLLPKLIRLVYRLFQRIAAWLRRDAPGPAGT